MVVMVPMIVHLVATVGSYNVLANDICILLITAMEDILVIRQHSIIAHGCECIRNFNNYDMLLPYTNDEVLIVVLMT